ncbi:MAG: glutamyl-tRNA reductase [Acidobacteria bacterium]|nr:glutamyl-tRNA reductase [Acidobacteriota bacterium]
MRERLAFDAGQLPAALEALRNRPGMVEGLILSTCNRVEIAATVEDDFFARSCLEQFLSEVHQIEPALIHAHLYHYEGRDAIRHLFRVASSLDSMIVGEPQILGQLKQAYAVAKEHGAVNGFLDTALTRAFSVAKRVRSETEIGQSAVSISYAAVELAREIFGSLKDRHVMIVGAGKMSELAARHLHRSGATHISVTNRTYERAEELARIFRVTIVPYDRFVASLPEMDIVIASSGAPHYILTKPEMRRVIEARKNRPMFLIDIAVPRNIDPAVNELENIFLYDIDDLQRVVESNLKGRSQVADEQDRSRSHLGTAPPRGR